MAKGCDVSYARVHVSRFLLLSVPNVHETSQIPSKKLWLGARKL